VLGDSSTIVTEKDKSRLQDLVTDYRPDLQKETHKADSVPAAPQPPKPDTTVKPQAPQVAAQSGSSALPNVAGLKAEFKETTVLIPNINAKLSGNPNLQNAGGAVYSLISGFINGNVLHTTGNVLKVSQRYQSIVVIKSNYATLPLETLSLTTDWANVKGGNGSYAVAGLEEDQMEFEKTNTAGIRTAVAKACQRRHMTRKKTEEWIETVGHCKSSNQKPCIVTLRSVMWKIDGRDAQGKPFSKQIRIDVPM